MIYKGEDFTHLLLIQIEVSLDVQNFVIRTLRFFYYKNQEYQNAKETTGQIGIIEWFQSSVTIFDFNE